MTKLESIREAARHVEPPIVQHTMDTTPVKTTVAVFGDYWLLQTGTTEPVVISDRAMSDLFIWLRDCIYAEAD